MSKLKEGDVIELKSGHQVYAKVPEHFVYSNRRGSFTLTRNGITIGGNFDYFQGKYVVYKTTCDGGGTGHGGHDVYPDGHHVFCEKLGEQKFRVDFYQTGPFTALIEDIEPIAQAKAAWSFELNDEG